jgi:uncharacterized membrane protein
MFEEHLHKTVELLLDNQGISIGFAIVIAVLFYFRPKDMFKLLGFCLMLVVAFYLMTQLAGVVGSGSKYKDQMTHKTSDAMKK